MKIDLPSFNGNLDVGKFLDWIKNFKSFFDCMETPDEKKGQVCNTKVEHSLGGTSLWNKNF